MQKVYCYFSQTKSKALIIEAQGDFNNVPIDLMNNIDKEKEPKIIFLDKYDKGRLGIDVSEVIKNLGSHGYHYQDIHLQDDWD